MKRNIFLLSAAVIASFASCTKESELDSSLESALSSPSAMSFTSYASGSTTTKGAAITSNDQFQTADTHGSFMVKALVHEVTVDDFTFTYYNEATGGNQASSIATYEATPPKNATAVEYLDFSQVDYSSSSSSWVNVHDMYWPNYSKIFYFAAYSPASIKFDTTPVFTSTTGGYSKESYSYSFPYTVSSDIDEQVDLMYAMTKRDYLAPSDKYKKDATDSYVTTGVGDTNTEDAVNLHFKHALTQIAFTATKDADLDVYVKSVTICNVYNNGTFEATDLTDDDDATLSNSTVGDSEVDGDKVDGDNFGSWTTAFADGWGKVKDIDYTVDTETLSSFVFFNAVSGSGGHSSMSHYEATLEDYSARSPYVNNSGAMNSIKIGDDVTPLTSSTNVLMLMPQELQAWRPTTSTGLNCIGYCTQEANTTADNYTIADMTTVTNYSSTSTDSQTYLAIDCEIYNDGATEYSAKIHDGYIFVPFETKDIKYSEASVDGKVSDADEWLPGYKITYCLNFGGGYVVQEGHTSTLPEPGCIPDTETYTLRTMIFTTSADDIVDTAASQNLFHYDTATGEATTSDVVIPD